MAQITDLRVYFAAERTLLAWSRTGLAMMGLGFKDYQVGEVAAPMVGGVITSTILELIIYPAICMIWKGRIFKN
ncbi:MAG: DUF202 domain-containing protein [Deltaproteobacteria bacterium]|nr:DUF202 domain-containing protein [Deltaproteobacteria bacterium]